MTFFMKAVRPAPGGGLVDLEGPATTYAVRSNTLFDVLDRIEDRKRVGGLQPSLFPWYQKSFDYDTGRKPEPSDCHRPKEVLASLQRIERKSFLAVHGDMLQQMKRVCLTALQSNALLFTSIR